MNEVDVARVILRGLLGSTMIAHGVRHGRTLPGTARWFEQIGFREPELQAKASAALEVGAGTAIVLGALTPLSCSSVVGTMAVAARSVHSDNGYFVVNEGYEYVLAVAGMAVALAGIGPGRYSVDNAAGLTRRLSGPRSALLALVIGLAGAAAQLATFWRRPAAR
jgi:putative oxidoreductase